MRVVQVVTLGSRSGSYGGPWSVVSQQSRTLVEAGHTVTVLHGVLPGDEPTPSNDQVRWVGVRVRRVIPIRRFSGLFSLRYALTTVKEIRNADIVHVSIAQDLIPLYASIVAIALGRALVTQPHGMLGTAKRWRQRMLFPVVKFILKRSQSVICLTLSEAEQLARDLSPQLETVVIGNAVPDELLDRKTERVDSNEVLFMSRMHSRKRGHVFIQAAKLAERRGTPCVWVMVGPDDGSLGEWQKLNETLGSPARFEKSVEPDRVYDRLALAGIFVLTADSEPYGHVLAAALALGLPSVVTQSSALAPTIQARRAGIVVPDDDPAAVAQAVDRLFSDKEFAQTISAAARQYARDELVESAIGPLLIRELKTDPNSKRSAMRRTG